MCEPCLKSRVSNSCHKCVMLIQMNGEICFLFTHFTFNYHVSDTKLIIDGKEFHQKCFSCLVCSVQLDKIYGSKDGEYYCETCYVDKFGRKCAQCVKVKKRHPNPCGHNCIICSTRLYWGKD